MTESNNYSFQFQIGFSSRSRPSGIVQKSKNIPATLYTMKLYDEMRVYVQMLCQLAEHITFSGVRIFVENEIYN